MRKLTFILILLLNVVYYSCSKDSSSTIEEKETTIFAMYNDFENSLGAIKLWKNGNITNVTNGTSDAYGSAMHVSNSDVYIVGDQDNSSTDNRDQKLWKNGVEVSLADVTPGVTFLKDVSYSNNTLYLLGYDIINNKNRIKLWKNGVASYVTDGTTNSIPQKIYVDNDDVYILGRTQNDTNSKTVLTVWKNGVSSSLTDGNNSVFARDIFVSNGNVYVLGREVIDAVTISKLWVNGLEKTIFDNGFNAEKLFVNNNDVYIVGTTPANGGLRTGKVYKNSELLADLGSGATTSYGISVFVKNDIVYAAFAEQIDNSRKYTSKLWVDGETKELALGWVEDIFVE
ncbi:hypothetical protein [Tenacibaculum crassostreae]|uniref:hypothetical protein n=1 Tax=Tenacibaculum crassostreae TaxID=502683 RepID=UPI00389312B7